MSTVVTIDIPPFPYPFLLKRFSIANLLSLWAKESRKIDFCVVIVCSSRKDSILCQKEWKNVHLMTPGQSLYYNFFAYSQVLILLSIPDFISSVYIYYNSNKITLFIQTDKSLLNLKQSSRPIMGAVKISFF